MQMHRPACACTCARMHMDTHTNMRVHTHTHTHTHGAYNVQNTMSKSLILCDWFILYWWDTTIWKDKYEKSIRKTNFTRAEGRSQEVGQWRFQRLLVQIWIQKHNYFLCECIDNTKQWWWWHCTGLESTIAMIITRWIMLRCTQGCNDIKCNNNATTKGSWKMKSNICTATLCNANNDAVLVWGNSYNIKSLRQFWIYAKRCFAIFYIFKQVKMKTLCKM